MPVSWKGSISFGLIYIPINLMLSAKESSIGFNMLHKKCKNRINYRKICPVCNEEVHQQDIVKGYNYEGDKYVVIEDEELERIKTPRDKSIKITQFVKLDEIDPIYYEKSYYVIPQGGEAAFELLRQAMMNENMVGIAKVVLGTKESMVAMRVNNGTMLLSTLYFTAEIKPAPQVTIAPAASADEIKLAQIIINNMTAPFHPEQYHDEYSDRVQQAIGQKISGQQIVTPEQRDENNIGNLMDALQASVAATAAQGNRTYAH